VELGLVISEIFCKAKHAVGHIVVGQSRCLLVFLLRVMQ